MEERRTRVQNICQIYFSHHVRTKVLSRNDLLLDYDNKVGYCRQCKAASSSILDYLALVNRRLDNVTRSRLRSDYRALHREFGKSMPGLGHLRSISKAVEHLKKKKIVTFSFVRHPFERYRTMWYSFNNATSKYCITIYNRLVSAFESKLLPTPSREKIFEKLSRLVEANFTKFADHVLTVSRFCKMKNMSKCHKNHIDVHWLPLFAR